MNEYMTTREVADLLSVNQQTVQRWCRERLVNHYRFGKVFRLHRNDVEDLIRRQRVKPVERVEAPVKNPGFDPKGNVVGLRRVEGQGL